MTKYNIVGIINLIFGLLQLGISIMPLYMVSRIGQLYSDLNVKASQNLTFGYIGIICMLLISLVNIILGFKGLSKSKEKEKNLKYGLITAIASIPLMALLGGLLVIGIIMPIYSLNQQF